MKTWKQKLVVGLAVLVAIGILAFQLLTSFGYVREMPPYLGETSYYSFDPETILTDLETEDRNLFLPLAEETFLAAQWSPNTIKLPYDGYSKILNAFYKFLWNEPLAKWDLDNMELINDDCTNAPYEFDRAGFGFHKHEENLYLRYYVRILLADGVIQVSTNEQKYTGKWKNIELNGIKINEPSKAVDISEANGGRNFRLKMKDDCHIQIILAPYAFDHIPPFNIMDWGWSVFYYGKNSSELEVDVNPFSGKYRIKN